MGKVCYNIFSSFLKWNSRYSRFFRTCSDQQLSFFTLLHRASFPHYNNTKITKFGWELFILWVISYGLSFSGFARFLEFRGTINDSFSSTCANTYQHSTSYKEISVPMMCLDCKSLLGNTKELQCTSSLAIHGSLNTILAQFMDGRSCH